MTLHVYAAHVQMPTLVLTPSLQPLASLDAQRFSIRLDSGAPFTPSSVRREGDDPLTVAVLLDAGGEIGRLATAFGPALVRLRTIALRPEDTLLLYAVDCKTVRFSTAIPATAAGTEHALNAVLSSALLHQGSTLPACGRSLRLWDSMMSMVTALGEQSGRRILLAITVGRDGGSKTSWKTLRTDAILHSVAIFALSKPEIAEALGVTESPLWNVCALSGGILLPADRPKDLPARFDAVVDMIRSRYILEFPRSNHLASGSHIVEVQVPANPTALVRLTGLSVPMLDQKLRDDPSTVPYLEADRPGIGGRRPLEPHPPQ